MSLWHSQVRRISADEHHPLTVDPEDVRPVDTVQHLPLPNLSAWSTSSFGLSVSASNKLNLTLKSFLLIPPEWTLTEHQLFTRIHLSAAARAAAKQRSNRSGKV